jgi:hypothetical protein
MCSFSHLDQVFASNTAIGVFFTGLHGLPAGFVSDQFPNIPAAGTGEQPQLAVARLSAHELQH